MHCDGRIYVGARACRSSGVRGGWRGASGWLLACGVLQLPSAVGVFLTGTSPLGVGNAHSAAWVSALLHGSAAGCRCSAVSITH